jgi:alkylation response protein AidB-like acyl-CoA dehydrogenase
VTVDLDLSDDQMMLREASSRFISEECPLPRVRELSEDHADPGPEYRLQAGDLGWFAMLVPDELGGGTVSGNGVVDAAIIAETRGRLLQPGAFVPTNAAVSGLVIDANPDQLATILPAIASGRSSLTWAVADATGALPADSGLRAVAGPDGFALDGAKGLVHDADRSDWMLVTAAGDGGPSQFLVPAGTRGVSIERLDGLDLSRNFCAVTFDDAQLPPTALVGAHGGAHAAVERQLQVASVLTVAESIGVMTHDFELALDYAKARVAFGRPIGSFQAVKHLLADTSLLLEASRAVADAAARAVGGGDADASEVASMAKAFVGDCGIDLAQNCFQVFGGIGYTWEHDQHLFMRRLTADAALYGDPTWHRERICRLHEL